MVLPQITLLSERAADEDFVRGRENRSELSPTEIGQQAVELYWAEFEAAWRAAVGSIALAEVGSLSEAADLVAAVSSPTMPFSRLAQSIAEQTNLAVLPEGVNVGSLPFDAGAAPDPYGPLRRAIDVPDTAEGEAAGPLAELTPILDDVRLQINRLDTRDSAAADTLRSETALTEAADALRGQGRDLPQPLGELVITLAARIADSAVGQARTAANLAWSAESAQICRAAVEGRYPFSRASTLPVQLQDFTDVFGPGGLFDRFFTDHLENFVDTTQDPWVFRGGIGMADADSSALAQFQTADEIQRAFFPNGSPVPRMDFSFQGVSFVAPANTVVIRYGGEDWSHRAEQIRSVNFTWPSQTSPDVEVFVLPRTTGGLGDRYTGVWAPFRLLDAGLNPQQISDEIRQITLDVDGRQATVNFRAGTVAIFSALDAMAQFRCPQGF